MKPKVAFYWCAACGGCEEMVVDLAKAFWTSWRPWTSCSGRWPWISRRADIEAMEDGSDRRRLHQRRRAPPPSRRNGPTCCAEVASRHRRGACAQMGGIPAWRTSRTAPAFSRRFYRMRPAP